AHHTIDISSPEVFFVGNNGQGKTNILEVLYLAAYGNSFRTRTESELYATHARSNEYRVKVMYRGEYTHTVQIFSKNGKKRIEKNLKKIRTKKELISSIPCILFFHNDLDFVVGTPERRRFFLDQSLSMCNPLYLEYLQKYHALTKTKNREIKEKRVQLLDALDTQIATVGFDLVQWRTQLVRDFNVIFTKYYERLGDLAQVRIEYKPSWSDSSVEEIVHSLYKRRKHDLAMGMSMSGPHRDKIHFTRSQALFIPQASTGQRRLVSLVLRMSQAVFYTGVTGKLPVLLMDDVLLELDPEKRERFMMSLPPYDQLFCTFLPGEAYRRYGREKTRVYFVSEGACHE
ncbi:DNA replication/repair protein RecF, partial [Treponema pallidum]